MRALLRRTRYGFTLIELIVVLLIIGVLATIATIAYTQITDRAQATRAQADLRNIAQAVLVEATVNRVDTLDRALVTEVLESSLGGTVTDGIAAVDYRLGYADQAPQMPGDLSVGFDHGDGVWTDMDGTRAILTTADGNGNVYATTVTTREVAGEHTHPAGTAPQDITIGDGPVDGGDTTPPSVPGYTFATTWDTTAYGCSGPTIKLPLVGTGEGTIDWGDGTTGELLDGASHTYATSGQYTVTVEGTFNELSMVGAVPTAPCLISVDQWGSDTGTTSMYGAFYEARNLISVAPPPSTVTNLHGTFQEARNFNGDISGWDTSNVTTMQGTFYGAYAFNQDLTTWDTSNVTNMSAVFYRANSFDGDVSTWDTSKVTDMSSMFFQAPMFNQDLSEWDTSQVTDLTGMFDGAERFNGNIAGWDTSNVTRMNRTFNNARSFNQDLSGWDTSAVTGHNSFDSGALVWTLPRPTF